MANIFETYAKVFSSDEEVDKYSIQQLNWMVMVGQTDKSIFAENKKIYIDMLNKLGNVKEKQENNLFIKSILKILPELLNYLIQILHQRTSSTQAQVQDTPTSTQAQESPTSSKAQDPPTSSKAKEPPTSSKAKETPTSSKAQETQSQNYLYIVNEFLLELSKNTDTSSRPIYFNIKNIIKNMTGSDLTFILKSFFPSKKHDEIFNYLDIILSLLENTPILTPSSSAPIGPRLQDTSLNLIEFLLELSKDSSTTTKPTQFNIKNIYKNIYSNDDIENLMTNIFPDKTPSEVFNYVNQILTEIFISKNIRQKQEQSTKTKEATTLPKQEAQVPQKAQEPPEAQQAQESQKAQEAQEPQKPQEPKKAQEAHEAQEPQEVQETQETPEVQKPRDIFMNSQELSMLDALARDIFKNVSSSNNLNEFDFFSKLSK